MRTLIVTVGTSLLTGRDEDRGKPWEGWRHGSALPDREKALAYLKTADARIACAETHTLEKLPLQKRDKLVFLHSDTEEGTWCAEVLAHWYESQGFQSHLRKISGLSYHAGSVGERGLKSLLQEAFDAIGKAERQQREVILCATGGFKSEIAFLHLVGLLMQIPVCYIHEQFRELLQLPALPIDWNMEIVKENEGFFAWIDAEPRSAVEAQRWLKATPALNPLVSEAEDGCMYLTAAGDLLYRAYKKRYQPTPPVVWPPDSTRLPKDKIQVSIEKPHHRPEDWENFVNDLARYPWVESIRYDGGGPDKIRKTRVNQEYVETLELGVTYCRDDQALPLRVGTTAQNEEQLTLVANWLRRELKTR